MRVRAIPIVVAVVAVMALAVLSPALRASPRDGFPLSTYPMFATDVGRTAHVDTAVGLRARTAPPPRCRPGSSRAPTKSSSLPAR